MTSASITAVARREMRDSLTDWRMMLPVLILTFVVPLLIQFALLFLLDYLGENGTIIRLIPFAVLLCGFLPASFSLIGALESFVGEKERNTLESLLAMPMNDSELYLGKLIAALASPMLSAVMAMVTFTVLIFLNAPAKVVQGLTPSLMLEMVALVICKAIVMVAAAVIISSHTTTTRAANLLASFVLVPMATIVQMEALLIIAQNQRVLFVILLGLIVIAIMLVRTGMSAFNREDILSREHAGFSFARIGWAFGRFWSSYQPAGVAPERYTGRFSVRRFYRQELPALLRDYRQPILVIVCGCVVAVVIGAGLTGLQHIKSFDRVLAGMGRPPRASLGLATQIFAMNARVSFFSNLFAPFSFGVFAFLVPLVAFGQIGYVSGWTLAHHGTIWPFISGYVLPHGIIELPAAIVSAALGLRIGASLLYTPRGFSIGQNMLWSLANFLKVWLFVVAPMMFIAALIEGLVTPHVIRAVFGT